MTHTLIDDNLLSAAAPDPLDLDDGNIGRRQEQAEIEEAIQRSAADMKQLPAAPPFSDPMAVPSMPGATPHLQAGKVAEALWVMTASSRGQRAGQSSLSPTALMAHALRNTLPSGSTLTSSKAALASSIALTAEVRASALA